MNKYILGGIGWYEASFLLLLAAKLWNVIDWSWWWVMGPLWIPFLACLVFRLVDWWAEGRE